MPYGQHQSGVTVRHKTQQFKEPLLSPYFAQMAECFKSSQVLHVMMDETRIADEATVNFCFWDPCARVAAWGPPQDGQFVCVCKAYVI